MFQRTTEGLFQPSPMASIEIARQEGRPAQFPQAGQPSQFPRPGMPAQYPQEGHPAQFPQEGRPAIAAAPEYFYIGDPNVDKYIHSFIG